MLRLTLSGQFSAAGADGIEFAIKSKKAKALLGYLALSPRMSRSRDEIMALLWSDRGEAQARASLRQVLVGLRKDLGEQAVAALMVSNETIALDPDKVTLGAPSSGVELLAGFHLHDPAFEEWLRDERLRHDDIAAPNKTPPELLLPDKPSVAVVPFINMSGDQEQEYFSDGITEDIITELARFHSLFVTARNSSFHYKNKSLKVQDIGRELGVHFVVEGSVRRAGSRVRISAQLIDAGTGNHLWAERYDRQLMDIFTVQDEVVQAIVASIPGVIDKSKAERALQKPSESLTAYDALLRGEWYASHDFSDQRAIEMFERAVDLDPRCARAYSKLAEFHGYNCLISGELPKEYAGRVKPYIEKALAIDNRDAVVRASAAVAYWQIAEHHLAKKHIDAAISFNPNDAKVMYAAVVVLSWLGHAEECLTWCEKLMRLDPHFEDGFREGMLDAFYITHRYDEAVALFQSWPNPPAHMYVEAAAAYAQLGQMDDAYSAIENYRSLEPNEYELNPDYICGTFESLCARKGDCDHWLDGYRKAGLIE